MRASEIIRKRPDVLRRVSVTIPAPKSAIGLAVGLLQDTGMDVEVEGRTLVLLVGPVFAGQVAMALERYTGVRACNGWEDASHG